MKLNKILSLLIISSSCIGLPGMSFADDLNVSNTSKFDLSFNINNACSTAMGTISNHMVTTIPEATFHTACAYNASDCVAKVYNAPACGGQQIATVTFNTSSGVQTTKSIAFKVRANGFNLFFIGPW